jgi:outer membrane receptor protein involved in Fe transport
MPWNFENNLFLVLIDGREANVELIGYTPWEIQPISLEDIERIEVIRGPASALYGPNAFAGVVSISTRSIPDDFSGLVRVTGGEVGVLSTTGRASARFGSWGLSASGGMDTMGRFTDPLVTGNRAWKFRALAEYRFDDDTRLSLDAGISDGRGLATSVMGTIDFGMALRTLRLAWESESVRAQLYWSWMRAEGAPEPPLEYGGLRLAEFIPGTANAHTLDGQFQYSLPRFWDPLLIIVGAGARVSLLTSDDMLDKDTYSDPSSDHYHELGVDQWEVRTGAFVHGELAAADWLTVTGGLRFDYNNMTDEFISPRLAAVFEPGKGQFLRLGVSRAFRKPAFLENGIHMPVRFPEDSPLIGGDRELFQEFMSRVIGNEELENEEILSFEAGYLGRFLDDRLNLSIDLYYNLYRNVVEMVQDIRSTAQGLPDLDTSNFNFQNIDKETDIVGVEVAARFRVSRALFLTASWTHRQVYERSISWWQDLSPKNLFTLGGRYSAERGLTGSLYLFGRSDFTDISVENPAGLLQPYLSEKMDIMLVALARLGWRFELPNGARLEAGLKLMLPMTPGHAPFFRAREKGGTQLPSGEIFGGDELRRMLTAYLQGSF